MKKKAFTFETPDTMTKVWIVFCLVMAFAFAAVYVYRIVAEPVTTGIIQDNEDTKIGKGSNPKSQAVINNYQKRENQWNDPVIP